jgi:hypothetical protein
MLPKPAGRLGLVVAAATLFVLSLAAQGGPRRCGAHTAERASPACSGTRLLHAGKARDRRPHYSRPQSTVTQLPAWAIPRLGEGREGTVPIRPSPRPVDLVDALLKAPDKASVPTIAALGLPIIEGVPPIVLLERGPEKVGKDFHHRK